MACQVIASAQKFGLGVVILHPNISRFRYHITSGVLPSDSHSDDCLPPEPTIYPAHNQKDHPRRPHNHPKPAKEFDEKAIEAVVNRILHERKVIGVVIASPALEKQTEKQPLVEEVNFDEAIEALGEGGFNVINDALNMFRNE